MADQTPHHDAPSLPGSPLPKRTKYTEPAPNLSVASILNDKQATPTPQSTHLPNPLSEMSAPINPTAGGPPSTTTLPFIPPMSFEPPPPVLQVKLLSETATAPTRGSAFAAGYDLYASKEAVVPARGKVLVDTDISIAVPANTYGRVAPRSGLASKHSIDTGAGVIDADYRGQVKVLLFNLSDVDFKVSVGERVAQLIIERIFTPEVLVVAELEATVRGAGGFGSTGGFGGTLPPLNAEAPALGGLPQVGGAPPA
ncbi:Putative deoxyuridine triphosphate nucleotidohydrolase, dUTPase, dUTPase-like superfamily [Septoria linicola]|uniref:Deoxyuridine 5'-triphosphate nucleotidohydrolase n=1 Tax=Septoria linicola TaxID=215465 RepID=A0A9Q9AYI9_9PEZI|nr:Putative deoxyuridine triphosphate nucleotidohydrolase, dUTPase, dUTPase-like superfamily [Septoria linicola]